jgi:peptidoglycan DL-endopeptidase CwlO
MHRSRLSRLRRTTCAVLVLSTAVSSLAAATPADAAHRVPGHVLRVGDTGQLVRKAQKLLGFPAPDGVYGRGTRGAVKHFQFTHHLLVDGQIGPQTWRALLKRVHHRPAHRRAGRHGYRRGDGVLQLGEKGRIVRRLQHALGIRVNGLYDRRTWRAVISFQRRHGLFADGEAGPQTLGALRDRHRASSGSARLGRRVVQMSRRYIGIRYTWGGKTPRSGFDCSGLVWYVYRRLGVDVPRVTYDQWHAGRHVGRRNLQPGDLLFFHRLGHVGIFVGHGWFIHAPRTGSNVHASRFTGWYRTHYNGAVRIG